MLWNVYDGELPDGLSPCVPAQAFRHPCGAGYITVKLDVTDISAGRKLFLELLAAPGKTVQAFAARALPG